MEKNYSFAQKNSSLYNKLSFFLALFFAIILFNNNVYAQDCTVNAGVPTTICANNPLVLTGVVGGNIKSFKWTQIAGPSVVIQNPDLLSTTVLGAVGGNTYTFRISGVCGSGTSFQDVTIIVNPITTATTGANIMGCPGTYALSGNAPLNTGETGLWTIDGNDSGVTIATPTSPTSAITFPPGSTGTSTLRWTITGPGPANTRCSSQASMTVTNYGGAVIANAGPDQNLSTCYDAKQAASLQASIGGNGTGMQIGTWGFVSGPSVPVIASPNTANTNISNLVEGSYVFRWTVQGPCAQGSDTVTINVPSATQGITNASVTNPDQNFCSGVTQTLLQGNVPLRAGETVEWTQIAGPAGTTIVDPYNPTTQVTGLNGTSNYTFRYTIKGGTVNPLCSSSSDINIRYYLGTATVSLNGGVNVLSLPENITSGTVTITASGGNRNVAQLISAPIGTTPTFNINGSNLNFSNLTKAGTYTFRVRHYTDGQVKTSCNEAFDDVNIIVSISPPGANAGTSLALACGVTEGTLSGNSPDATKGHIGRWSQLSGPSTTTFSDVFSTNPVISNLTPGIYTYRWTITGGLSGIDQFSDVNITVSAPPTSTITPNLLTSCAGNSLLLTGNELVDGTTGLWQFVSGPGTPTFTDPTKTTTSVIGLLPSSTYVFSWTVTGPNPTDIDTCGPSTANVTINTLADEAPSIANAGPDTCFPIATNSATLGASAPTVGTGAWSFVSGPNTPVITNPALRNTTITGLVNGIYEFEWTTSNLPCGIPSKDRVKITVAAEPTSNAGPDQNAICGSTITMAANLPDSGLIGTWIQISGSGGWSVDNINSPTAVFSNLTEGNYEFQWKVAKGSCTSKEDNLKFRIQFPPTTANAGVDQTICGGTTATLAALPVTQGVGTWSVISGPNNPTITTANGNASTVTGLVTGTYTLRWTTSSGGICPESSDDMILNVSAPVSVITPQNLCAATSVLLEGNMGSSGVWTLLSSTGGTAPIISTIGPNSASATITPGFDYVFTYTTASFAGCDAGSANVDITNSAIPATPYAGPDQSICTSGGTSVTMAATGTPGTWVRVSGPNTPTISSTIDPNAVFSNLIEGLYVYQWTTSNGNCLSLNDVVRIYVYDPPSIANAGPDQTSCQLATQLNATVPSRGIGKWTLTTDPSNGGIIIDSPNDPKSKLTIANPYLLPIGTYTFTWTVTNGPLPYVCDSSMDTVDINFSAVPPTPANAGPDQTLCAVTTVTMNANNINPGKGTWTQVSGPNTGIFSDNFSPQATITGLVSGVYEFKWTSSNTGGGCKLEDNVKVTISPAVANVNAGPDQFLGEYSTVTMAALNPSPNVGVWSIVSGPNTPLILNVNSPTTQIAGTIPGTYVLRYTVANGFCAEKSDDVVIVLTGQTDLSLLKTVNASTPAVGSTVTFTVAVKNNGARNATGVAVNDILPSGLTLVPGTVSNAGTVNAGNNSITWSGLSIANGATLNLTYKVKVNATTGVLNEYKNTAQITASDQIDPNSTPNNNIPSEDDQDSLTLTPTPNVDLAITKQINNATPNVGSTVQFTIEVVNNGPSNATGVVATDNLPSGYTFSSATTSFGAYNSGTGQWAIENLAIGTKATLTISATVNPSGNYTNTTTVASTEIDGNLANNTSVVSSIPRAIADLSLTKTISAGPYNVGSNVTFTVTVSNAGPNTATGVSVVDYLPSGYTYVSHTSTGTYSSTTGSWNVETINSGSSAVLNVVARINATGDYRNTAQVVHSDQIDPDSTPGNNNPSEDDQAQVIITPVQLADLSLVKTVNVAAPRVGDNVKFTMALNNAGPSDASAVVVNDLLPSGYTFVSYTSTSGSYNATSGDWTLSGSILNGKTEYLDIVAKVNPITGATNEYTNNAQVIASGQTDPDSTPNDGTGDDFSTVTTVPTALINLSLTKAVDNIAPLAGSNVVFTITVKNVGPSSATGIQVRDALPSGYTYVSDDAAGSYNGGIWTIPSIANGSSAVLNVTARVNATGNYTNVAEVIQANETDSNSTPNNNILAEDDQDQVTTSREPLVDLSLIKSVDNETPNVGDNVTFRITVSNAGPSDATGVVVTDKLPSGYSFVSATPSIGTYENVQGSWTVGDLANVGTATLEIIAKVLPTGNYNNIAEVTGTNEVDSNSTPGNNDATENDQKEVIVTPIQIADLSVVKTVNTTTPNVGDNVTFTIAVSNAGPSDATGVIIADQLPSGYEFVSASPTAGMYNRTTGEWTVSRPIVVNSTETIQITAKVLKVGDYINTAEVTKSDQIDPDSTPGDGTGDDFSTVTTTPIPLVNLALIKRINNPTPDVGSTVLFTLEVVNNGPSDATSVVVTDNLPSGYSYVSSTPSIGVYNNTSGNWTIGNLANGAKATINILATVNPTGDYTNTATVSSTENDGNPTDNTSSTSSTPRPVADLSLIKTVVNASPNVGENAVFNLVVTNNGPSTATNVVVTDKLLSGYEYLSSVPSLGNTYSGTSGAWVVGSLASGASATLSITAKVLATGNYTNIAEVTNSDQFDPNSRPGNNNPSENDQDEVIVTPVNVADLVTVKTVSAVTVSGISASNPNEGDIVKYTIVVTNNGGPTKATGVSLVDILPSGVTYIGNTTSVGSYNYGSGIWTIGNLNVNNTATLEISAKVNVGTGGTSITNRTTAATGDQTDPTTDGDDLEETIIVNLPPIATNDSNSGNITNQPSAPINILGNDTLSDGTPATVSNTIVDLNPNTPGVDNTLVVLGEGTWSYNPANGELIFTPEAGFTTDPTPIVYKLTETQTGLSDTATVTVDYDIQAPVANDDLSIGNPINIAVTVNPLTDNGSGPDSDPDGTIDPTTVSLVKPTGATSIVTDSTGDITSFDIPNEGKWSVDPTTGAITFTPLPTFQGDPTPIQYNIKDNDGNQSNDATVTIKMIPQADLIVTKTDNKEKYTPGTSNTYTITIKNNGPAVATDVVVLDDIIDPILEAVTTWTAVGTGSAIPSDATGTGDITANNGKIATIAIGEIVTYTVTIAVPSNYTGQIVNTANATSAVQDPNPDNNSQTDTDTMNPLAEIAVTKEIVSAAPHKIGDTIEFLITAINNGPSDATGINIVDKLPSGYSFVSGTSSQGTYNSSNGLWNVGSLVNQATATLNVFAKINATGNYTNSAEVTKVDQLDPNGVVHGNNTPGEIDQDDVTIIPVEIVDLVTTKTVDKSNPNQGDIVKYTITVVNKGPSIATGVSLIDNLPLGTVYVSHVATGGTVNTYSGGQWTIGNMNIGSSATLVIDARVTAVGTTAQTPIINTTTAAAGDQSDPTTVGDDLTEPIIVTSSDLVTKKTVTKATPSEGEIITYIVEVTNNGPSDATGVRLTDILPIGVTYVSNNHGTDYNYGSGIWTIGDLANGATKVLNIDVIINSGSAGKTIVNTTTAAKGNQSDPTTVGDDLTETIIVQNGADVVLKKVVDNKTPNIGDIVTYTVTVANKGTTLVTNLVVKDELPVGLTLVSATPGKGTWLSPNWTIGELKPGEEGSIEIKAMVGLDQGGSVLTNTVSNTQDQFDTNTTPDDHSETITVTSLDLAVVKTVNNAIPNEGEIISYTIAVTNNGANNATNVSLFDKLPVGVTYVSDLASSGNYNNGSGLWTIGDLVNGAVATLTINAKVDANTYGKTITNTTSAVKADQADSNPSNDVGSVAIVPTAYIDLSLTKEVVANVTNPAVGDQITFEIRVMNDGPTKATGVQVVDLIPSGYKFINYSSSIGTYNPTTGLWNVGFVEVGNTAILLVDVKVLDKGNYINCAEITKANEPDIDSTPGNGDVAEDDYACASAPPNQSVDLAVVKTILKNNTSPKVNSQISFEILLINNGNIDATNVVVSDLLPSGYTFVNYSSTKGIYDYVTGDWKVSKIVNGETEILIVDVIVNESGDYLNCASIKALHQVDTDPANNVSCIATTPIAVIDLELTKEVDEIKPVAETNVEFTITLSNKGPSKGTGIEVKDLLPSGFNFVSATTTTGVYDPSTGIWKVGTIDINAVQTLKVVAYVLPVGNFTNVAEVIKANELDVDSTPGNNKLQEDDQDAVTVEPLVSLVIPEGFTPNGDGVNDVFEIEHLQVLYPNFSMEIVNRYGNIVYNYKHNGDKFKTPLWWDGHSTGRWNLSKEMLPTGTYFYTIYFNNDERKPQTGWIYLKK